jgi:hypothetical protein
MSTWQYQCVSCGGVHDAPLRPGGPVYLRCTVTRLWAWHEPSRFLVLTTEAPANSTGAVKKGPVRARDSSRRRPSSAKAPRRRAVSRTPSRKRRGR